MVDAAGAALLHPQEQWEEWGQGLVSRGGLERGGLVGPLQRSSFLGRPTLLAVHSIQGRDDRTIGYFVERVDLRELEALLGPAEGDPPHSFWLLDEQGKVLVRAGKVPDAPGVQPFPVPLPAEGDGRAQGTLRLDGLGTQIYGIRRLQGPTRGYLVATVAESAAYRPLTEARNRLLRLGCHGGGRVVGSSWPQKLLRPIHRIWRPPPT